MQLSETTYEVVVHTAKARDSANSSAFVIPGYKRRIFPGDVVSQ
jgi:hypothetical protein